MNVVSFFAFLLLCCSSTEMTDHENQLYQIQSLIDQLPPVNHATLKRVIGHLNRIKEQEEKNKMGLNNIVKIFGPTLMTVDGDTVSESFVCVCIHRSCTYRCACHIMFLYILTGVYVNVVYLYFPMFLFISTFSLHF